MSWPGPTTAPPSLRRKRAQQVARANEAARAAGLRGELDLADWLEALGHFDDRCAYCGAELLEDALERRDAAHLDVVIPVARGGHACAGNVVPICHDCRQIKQARSPSTPGFWARFPAGGQRRVVDYLRDRGGPVEPGPWTPRHYRPPGALQSTCGRRGAVAGTLDQVTCDGCLELAS